MISVLSIFRNKWVFIVLIIILFQQLLVAAGTYFLGELSGQFPTHGFQPLIAIFLFFCIFLPGTIVHYGVVWCSVRAYKMSQLRYLKQYIQSNYNHPTFWRDTTLKHQRHDIMCRGGQDTIQTTLHFFIDVVATSLNIILNTISIIFVTDITLGIIILVAGFLGLWIISLSEAKITKNSRREMLAENKLNAHLSRSWDNIILGNISFFERWNNYFKKIFLSTEKASLQTVRKRDWAVCVAGMVTNGIVLGGALLLAWVNRYNAAVVLAILVMLPRSLQIVMHIQIIQRYAAQWKNLRAKLVITEKSFSQLQKINLDPYIKKNEISILINNTKQNFSSLDNFLIQNKTGRITIVGKNGSGKSSLLLKLKDRLNTSAIYLPAHHQLILSKKGALSSGEVALAAFSDLLSEKCPYILLDEWDANLSAENRIILDKMIEQMSKERIIIEIRHPIN